MSNYHDDTDLTTLIGQTIPSEYIEHERERELLEAAASDFEGYDEWSEDVENFHVKDRQVHHKPEPKSNGFIGAIEI